MALCPTSSREIRVLNLSNPFIGRTFLTANYLVAGEAATSVRGKALGLGTVNHEF